MLIHFIIVYKVGLIDMKESKKEGAIIPVNAGKIVHFVELTLNFSFIQCSCVDTKNSSHKDLLYQQFINSWHLQVTLTGVIKINAVLGKQI